MIGYALLKITPHGRIQIGKIVDCWLDTEDPSSWQAVVATLIDRLRALSADFVTCYGTTPSLQVNGTYYPLTQLLSVSSAPASTTAANTTTTN